MTYLSKFYRLRTVQLPEGGVRWNGALGNVRGAVHVWRPSLVLPVPVDCRTFSH